MRETLKNVKMLKFTLLDLEYGKKSINMENETETLFDLEYGEQNSKT